MNFGAFALGRGVIRQGAGSHGNALSAGNTPPGLPRLG